MVAMMMMMMMMVSMVGLAKGFGSRCPLAASDLSTLHPSNADMPPDFKVAFLGDQGTGNNPRAVLEMIRDWGAQAVVHAGDFDYENDPPGWIGLINDGTLPPLRCIDMTICD